MYPNIFFHSFFLYILAVLVLHTFVNLIPCILTIFTVRAVTAASHMICWIDVIKYLGYVINAVIRVVVTSQVLWNKACPARDVSPHGHSLFWRKCTQLG